MKRIKTLSELLVPDYCFDKFDDVSPEFLRSIGIRALLIDIDNTLAPYEQDVPDEHIIKWFDALRAAGISASLISNNGSERVELFNRELRLPAFPKSKKPSRRCLLRAMEAMGSSASDTAALGDQLLTDALGAHRLGLVAIIVPPIKDKKNLLFRFKRLLERPYMKKYGKKNKVGG